MIDADRIARVQAITPEHLPLGRLTLVTFGPGRGEAIVVGLPDGRVGILDGCLEREDPVLRLLEDLVKSRPDLRIAFLGLTHPHDDHYAGLATILDRFEDRIEAVWDSPLTQRHAKALLKLLELSEDEDGPPSNLPSLETLLSGFARFAHGKKGDSYRIFCRNKRMWEGAVGSGPPLRILGCGPHDADERSATLDLAQAARDLAEGRSGRRGIDPNWMSGAVQVEWGEARLLLGGDLLAAEGRYRGWSGVRDLFQKDLPVQVVKAAHHASAGAHDDEIWKNLVPKLVIVTPFKNACTSRNGTSYPPRPEDVRRLGAAGADVILSSPPAWPTDAPVSGRRPRLPLLDTGERNEALGETAPAERRAAHQNAVAVSLNEQGEILGVTLAGEADFYQ